MIRVFSKVEERRFGAVTAASFPENDKLAGAL